MDNQILRLMNVLLSARTDVEEKQKVMQEEFHIAMTMELGRICMRHVKPMEN